MLKPLAATLSSSCTGSGLGVNLECVAKHCYLTRCPNRQQHILRKCSADISDSIHQEEKDVSKATLIWRAIKLPIYSVALVPLTVGGAVAYLQTGLFFTRRYLTLLASSVLVIAWINLSNDVYDFDTGADKNKKESVVNMVGSRSGPFLAAYLSLAVGFMGLAWVAADAGNMRSLLLLACAITCGYIYQCPPFRLSYQGLGEPLCFAAFGPFATTAFYLLLGSTSEINFLPLTRTVLSASLLVGLTTTLILFCSHFHQVEEDLAVGKMSPLVKMGTERGAVVVKGAVLTLYSLLFALGLCRALPLTCLVLCALTLPIGKLVVSYVEKNHKVSSKLAWKPQCWTKGRSSWQNITVLQRLTFFFRDCDMPPRMSDRYHPTLGRLSGMSGQIDYSKVLDKKNSHGLGFGVSVGKIIFLGREISENVVQFSRLVGVHAVISFGRRKIIENIWQ
ncbi:UbiA prenyltransferase family [Corchorus olitorius]|uniref:UbiA prenyltransferase family n=1 Tax=Corchorus olitorius TaxID=93759 RepID=A0A1R3H011_9ROSI|nr:UbiA prenyltransferase family [Corchorus olitorius]